MWLLQDMIDKREPTTEPSVLTVDNRELTTVLDVDNAVTSELDLELLAGDDKEINDQVRTFIFWHLTLSTYFIVFMPV